MDFLASGEWVSAGTSSENFMGEMCFIITLFPFSWKCTIHIIKYIECTDLVGTVWWCFTYVGAHVGTIQSRYWIFLALMVSLSAFPLYQYLPSIMTILTSVTTDIFCQLLNACSMFTSVFGFFFNLIWHQCDLSMLLWVQIIYSVFYSIQ